MPHLEAGVGVDRKVDAALKAIPRLSFIESSIEEALSTLLDMRFDLVLMISVLEHVWDPGCVLTECRRVLRDGGSLFVNVPTWRGKTLLECSAFRVGASPADEVDDHKMHYDKRDRGPCS